MHAKIVKLTRTLTQKIEILVTSDIELTQSAANTIAIQHVTSKEDLGFQWQEPTVDANSVKLDGVVWPVNPDQIINFLKTSNNFVTLSRSAEATVQALRAVYKN